MTSRIGRVSPVRAVTYWRISSQVGCHSDGTGRDYILGQGLADAALICHRLFQQGSQSTIKKIFSYVYQ